MQGCIATTGAVIFRGQGGFITDIAVGVVLVNCVEVGAGENFVHKKAPAVENVYECFIRFEVGINRWFEDTVDIRETLEVGGWRS
ncbi:hypothetical protein [Alteribacter keqinensis]|uniref:hypothetical protein n=1 Tax=Alteribacter keqinensis TaxID=2483800 RepID=UPI0020179523|nr:hypothetical protein [Alteribacter keqinensis]